MVKIRIYFICEILLLSKVIESFQVTLSETTGNDEQVTCPVNKTISWKWITYGESQCKDVGNNNICHSNVNSYFNDQCLGQNMCILPIDILSNNSCQRPPRLLKVTFQCIWTKLVSWFDKYPTTVYTCVNSLGRVNCPSWYHIRIINVNSYSYGSGSDIMDPVCARNNLETLCNNRRWCSSYRNKYTCLYDKRFASISYFCSNPTDPLITEAILSTKSSTDHEFDRTTISAENAPSERDQRPVLRLDDNHRVEFSSHSHNKKLYLCSSGWDDLDAGVLCKSFNKTWIGKATIADKFLDKPIFPYSMHCDGLESSLLDCNFTEDGNCNTTTKVAGAICCQGTDTPGECVTNPPPDKLALSNSGFPTLGVAVGVPVGIIVIVCIIVAVVLIRRRCTRENSDKKFSNFMSNATDENYLGQQDIALPQYPTNNKVLYSQVQKHDTDTIKNEDGQDCSHPSKDTESPYALSEEGVYDKTDDRRHVVNDTDMYSRTVDTVYDSAEQHLKEDRKEETYDHFFGQKTEDFYDQTTRT